MQGVIPGFAKALAQTQAGGKYLVHIPAKLAYGDHAQGPIPANSDLTFEIEVLQFANRAELEAQQRMMEQIMRQQAAGKGAQGAPKARRKVLTLAPLPVRTALRSKFCRAIPLRLA
jgi:FKBP-type peptidyl-prolyl cis-trans isomerase FkpA